MNKKILKRGTYVAPRFKIVICRPKSPILTMSNSDFKLDKYGEVEYSGYNEWN